MDIKFKIDGKEICGKSGQTIMEAADEAGIYIPRLCDVEFLKHQGSCRVCVVKANGSTVSSCTQPVTEGMVIEHETDEINLWRKNIVSMLFQEGNHLCPGCEASGKCELQGMAYKYGITNIDKYRYIQPSREIDATHPDILLDTNRCILCARCIRTSKDVDNKHVFGYIGRGVHKKVGINADSLKETNVTINDAAIDPDVCPVGCIIRKREGFATPIGERDFDHKPIGSDIAKK